MIRLLACLALCLALFTPASASSDALDVFAHWAGADSGLDLRITQTDDPDISGGFIPPGTYCMMFGCMIVERPTIFVSIGKDVPLDAAEFIIAHELRHYVQWKLGYLEGDFDHLVMEHDADIAGQQAMCRIGQPQAGEDAFNIIHQVTGYEGDEDHGTLASRISAVRSACEPDPVQGA
jgi:hypothetical protein